MAPQKSWTTLFTIPFTNHFREWAYFIYFPFTNRLSTLYIYIHLYIIINYSPHKKATKNTKIPQLVTKTLPKPVGKLRNLIKPSGPLGTKWCTSRPCWTRLGEADFPGFGLGGKRRLVIDSYKKAEILQVKEIFGEFGWWFQKLLFSPRNLGKWSNLTVIFFEWVVQTTNWVSLGWKQKKTINYPRHPVIFSADDWGVQSPPKRIGHLGSMKPLSVSVSQDP